MNFNIEITETLRRVVTVEADTIEEAISKVENRYDNGTIVLDSSHYVDTEIKEAKDA